MSSIWGDTLKISIFGESHGSAIGAVIDGLPSGESIDFEEVAAFMQRRAPRSDGTSTKRKEADAVEIISGMLNSCTTGAPLCATIKNTDTRSGDYDRTKNLARPGHADFTGHIRYNGYNDTRGGGHFSGRLTAPLVFAGAICSQILARKGIVSGAHILSVGNVTDSVFDSVNISAEKLTQVRNSYPSVINDKAKSDMVNEIERARLACDSVGGIVECATVGFPAGIGSPMFDGLENRIASLVFGIPAVKGIEFGAGFEAAKLHGSENNDSFYVDTDGATRTRTNNHGGILGGISSGMPIILRVAFKPTPSIAQKQETIDLLAYTNTEIEIIGRHDPCVVPRAAVCVESAVNIALLSALMA